MDVHQGGEVLLQGSGSHPRAFDKGPGSAHFVMEKSGGTSNRENRRNILEMIIHTRDGEGLNQGSSCRSEDRQEKVFLRNILEVKSAETD